MVGKLFTSESVTEGHPDKICDAVADAILDATLERDPDARVACEVFCTTGVICIMGEITSSYSAPLADIARRVITDIGYDDAAKGFDGNTCAVLISVKEQSPDIAAGVTRSYELREGAADALSETGAGDQGIMFGYATDETPTLMPLTAVLSHALARRLAEVRKTGVLPYLRPDGKTQVTAEYGEDGSPRRVDTVVVSAQHEPDVDGETLRADIEKHVIRAVIPDKWLDDKTKFLINPTGRFVVGGPQGDTGLTGRKIIVDSYGGCARHGGGACSGKDPSKVDRSAAYAARYAAKNVVAAGLARRCEVQLAYAIGVARPVSVSVDTFGTSRVPEDVLSAAVESVFDFRPGAIIRAFDLRRPIYKSLSNYGAMGREDLGVPWESTDKKEALLAAVERLSKVL